MHSGTFHDQKNEGAPPSTEVSAPKAKNPPQPCRATMGQVEPVNYSNAALEQRRKGTNPASMGKKYLLYQMKSIWESWLLRYFDSEHGKTQRAELTVSTGTPDGEHAFVAHEIPAVFVNMPRA